MQLFFIQPTECIRITITSYFIEKIKIKYDYQSDQFQQQLSYTLITMIQQSYTFMTMTLVSNTTAILLLQYLGNTQTDQADILNQLTLILQSHSNLAYLYSQQISIYLCKNIEKGMNVIQTISCLLNTHAILRIEDKQKISSFLERQYKLQDSQQELKKLQKVNRMLIPNFLQVINGLGEWYRMQLQQRDFTLVQNKDWANQLDILYITSRYQFEKKTEQNFKTEQSLLCIYRLLFENQFLFAELLKSQIYVQKLYCSLFYVSSLKTLSFSQNYGEKNIQFGVQQNQRSELKVVTFVIGEIYGRIQNYCKQGKKSRLIENYRQSILKNTLNDQDEYLQRIKAGISGLIASKLSLDKQLELLWLTIILLDIKTYSSTKQAAALKEIKTKSVKLRILLENISL